MTYNPTTLSGSDPFSAYLVKGSGNVRLSSSFKHCCEQLEEAHLIVTVILLVYSTRCAANWPS